MIYPFLDGNGRLGGLQASMSLTSAVIEQ